MEFGDMVGAERARVADGRARRAGESAREAAAAAARDRADEENRVTRRAAQREAAEFVLRELHRHGVEGPAMYEARFRYRERFERGSFKWTDDRLGHLALPTPLQAWVVGEWREWTDGGDGFPDQAIHPIALLQTGQFLEPETVWRDYTLGLPDGVVPVCLGVPPDAVVQRADTYARHVLEAHPNIEDAVLEAGPIAAEPRGVVDECEDLPEQMAAFIARVTALD